MLRTSRITKLYDGGLACDFEERSRARLAELKVETSPPKSHAHVSSFSSNSVASMEAPKVESEEAPKKVETQVDVEDGTRNIPISRRGKPTSRAAAEVPAVDASSGDLRQLPMDALRRRARAIGVALPRSCTHAVACQILLDAGSGATEDTRTLETAENNTGTSLSTAGLTCSELSTEVVASPAKKLIPTAARQISATAAGVVVEVDVVEIASESIAASSQGC
jgi:hypothetical protein